jgi:predicted lipoprotein with Yx(FWY)xxD motif
MQTTFTVQARDTGTSGKVLAAGNGMTLYVFDHDAPHVSTCTAECARVWPPLLLAQGDPIGTPDLPGVLSVITGPDGRRQVAYNDQPLYFYSSDTQPGDVNGNGIDGVWHVARPSVASAYQQQRAALTATVRADDQTEWQPPSVAIAPGGTVTWENHDPTSDHLVECLQAESSDVCPWAEALFLPLATTDDADAVVPSTASVTFPGPGIYAFRCALFPDMTGTIIVGAPA